MVLITESLGSVRRAWQFGSVGVRLIKQLRFVQFDLAWPENKVRIRCVRYWFGSIPISNKPMCYVAALDGRLPGVGTEWVRRGARDYCATIENLASGLRHRKQVSAVLCSLKTYYQAAAACIT